MAASVLGGVLGRRVEICSETIRVSLQVIDSHAVLVKIRIQHAIGDNVGGFDPALVGRECLQHLDSARRTRELRDMFMGEPMHAGVSTVPPDA